MASGGGDDSTLIKIAIFGIAFSMIVTGMVTMLATNGDYDYDTIAEYRSKLVDFSGDSMLNETPWVLTHCYTPFIPGSVAEADVPNHIDEAGWLFGEDIVAYSQIGKSADISLDKNQCSNQYLTTGDVYNYSYQAGEEWWNGGNDWDIVIMDPWLANLLTGGHSGDGYKYVNGSGNNWNYTGYRYVFDPTLPFSAGTSSKDGQLSIVWYNFGDESGLSGGLDIYGTNHQYGTPASETRLARISASDLILGYESNGGYATVYDFDFNGIKLHLSIRFNPDVASNYPSLRAAWDDGAWTMAVSTASAGNFFDVENSNTFVNTAGSMVDTFIEIYTFDYPEFDEPWVNVVLWLMVGLPMTMGMLLVSMRLVGGIFKIF